MEDVLFIGSSFFSTLTTTTPTPPSCRSNHTANSIPLRFFSEGFASSSAFDESTDKRITVNGIVPAAKYCYTIPIDDEHDKYYRTSILVLCSEF